MNPSNPLVRTAMRLNSSVRVVLLVVCALLGPALARAQFNATVQGTVVDAKGGVVAGATVTLTDQSTQVSKTTTTSSEGFYRFSEVAPGRFTVTAEAPGFQKKIVNDVTVSAELARGLDIKLDVGATTQSVTVNGSNAAALETEEANIETTLTNAEVERMPEFGRDVYELIRFAPGIFADMSRNAAGLSLGFPNGAQNGSAGPGGSNTAIYQTENQLPISANGQRLTSNDYQIDGVGVNSQQFGGAAVITPSIESVQEITVLANDYDAADGRNSGAHIKTVTKAGSNDFHGAAFFQYQTPGLNAFNKYNGFNFSTPTTGTLDPTVRDQNKYREFGGNLGGAILKNKLFFFFNYEGLRDNTSTFQNQWVDTPDLDSLLAAYSPNTPVSGTLADPGIAPRVKQVLAPSCLNFPGPCQIVGDAVNIGSPTGTYGTYLSGLATGTCANNIQCGAGLTDTPEFEFAQIFLPVTTSGNQYNARVDYNMGRSVFSASTFLTRYNQLAADASAQGRPMADYNADHFTPAGFLSWVFNISPTMVNEARFNFTRWAFNDISSNPQINWAIPRTEIQNALPNGQRIVFGAAQGDTSPGVFAENTFAFRDVLSKVHNQHAFRFGVEFDRLQNNDDLIGSARPDIVFTGPWNFAVGTSVFEAVNVNPLTGAAPDLARAYRTSDYGLFVQDDWKFRPNLTFNLGLRWDYFAPPTDAHGQLWNFVPGSSPVTGLLDAKAVNSHQMYNADYHNFGPRTGFAWSPGVFHSKAVVRGGFGIAFDRNDNNSFDITRNNPPLAAQYFICCGGPGSPPPPADSQLLYALGTNPRSPTSFPADIALANGIDANNLPNVALNFAAPSPYSNPQNFPSPYIYLYSAQVQYALPMSWVATLGYQGSSSHGLLRLRNLQYFYTDPNPSIGAAFQFTPDTNAHFNALNTEIKRNFHNGLLLDVLYNYSRSIDQVSAEGPGFTTNQTYPTNDATERGPSDYDVPHNLRVFGLWDLPIFRDRRDFAGKVLGGWEINGDFQFHSGFPWTPVASNNCNLVLGSTTICPLRPIGLTNAPGTNSDTPAFLPPLSGNFPNGGPAYFDVTASGVPGIGRNSERGPRFSQFDFSFAKNFGLPQSRFIGENSKIQLRMNIYNAFNKLNLAPFTFGSQSTTVAYGNNCAGSPPVCTPIANPNFGLATNGLAGRTMELEGRFVF